MFDPEAFAHEVVGPAIIQGLTFALSFLWPYFLIVIAMGLIYRFLVGLIDRHSYKSQHHYRRKPRSFHKHSNYHKPSYKDYGNYFPNYWNCKNDHDCEYCEYCYECPDSDSD